MDSVAESHSCPGRPGSTWAPQKETLMVLRRSWCLGKGTNGIEAVNEGIISERRALRINLCADR